MPTIDESPTQAQLDRSAIDAVEDAVDHAIEAGERYATITTQEQYAAAAEYLTTMLKPALQELRRTFKPMKQKAAEAHKEICAQERRHADPLVERERVIKAAMGQWALARQRELEAAEAERQREAREEAEAAKLAEAQRLEEAGHTEAAEEKVSEPVVPVVAAPPASKPDAEGVSTRFENRYRIINPAAIGPDFLVPDEAKIAKTVKALGADAERLVGGIEVYQEPIVSARAR